MVKYRRTSLTSHNWKYILWTEHPVIFPLDEATSTRKGLIGYYTKVGIMILMKEIIFYTTSNHHFIAILMNLT